MALALEGEDRFPHALAHEPGAGVGHIGLGDAAAGPRLAWNRDETRCLVLEGEIYDLAPLEQSLVSDPPSPPPASQAELLLRLYEQFGVDFLAKLNGAFALAIWDRRERQLVLANDRLGLCPVYYARVNGDLLFASGVRALLPDPGLNRPVDLVALNQFLVYDHVLDDRTFLEAVRLLPQGSILTFRTGQVAIRTYWTLRYPEVYRAAAGGGLRRAVHPLYATGRRAAEAGLASRRDAAQRWLGLSPPARAAVQRRRRGSDADIRDPGL